MLTGAKAQEYDRLRQLGHTTDCAYEMASNQSDYPNVTECTCNCPGDAPVKEVLTIKARQQKHRERIRTERTVSIDRDKKKRGRPRKFACGADRQAAYRDRKLEESAAQAMQIISTEIK